MLLFICILLGLAALAAEYILCRHSPSRWVRLLPALAGGVLILSLALFPPAWIRPAPYTAPDQPARWSLLSAREHTVALDFAQSSAYTVEFKAQGLTLFYPGNYACQLREGAAPVTCTCFVDRDGDGVFEMRDMDWRLTSPGSGRFTSSLWSSDSRIRLVFQCDEPQRAVISLALLPY